MWSRMSLGVWSGTVELPRSLLRFFTSSLLGFCWQDRLSKQRRDLNLAQSQKMRAWEGNVASFPFLFGPVNLSLFLRYFSNHDLEQEGLGGSCAWSGVCLHLSELCGWVLRWRMCVCFPESWAVGEKF